MREVLAELLFRLRAGPRRTWTWLFDRLTDRAQDRRFGLETTGRRMAGSNAQESVRYQPVSYRDLRESLALVNVSYEDHFLDVGSGMGRPICFAATMPFHKVTGVEISAELCAAARRNAVPYRQVEIVLANVLKYAIPADVSLIFLFNPLAGQPLRELLSRIELSWMACPRSLRVLFTGTLSSQRFAREAAQHPLFHLIEEKVLRTGARALLYNVQNHP